MKKLLLYCFAAVIALSGLAWRATAADRALAPQVAAVNLSAMPLMSRSLSELAADKTASPTVVKGSHSFNYRSESEGPGWLFASIAEPFYLSLLGAILLILGTVSGSAHRDN